MHKEIESRIVTNSLSEDDILDQLEAELLAFRQQKMKSNPDIAGFKQHLRRVRKIAHKKGKLLFVVSLRDNFN